MEAMLTFFIPDEETELRVAIDGMAHIGAIRDFQERLRSLTKYGHGFQTVEEALSSLYSDYCGIMEEFL